MPHKDPEARAKYAQEYAQRNRTRIKEYQHEWYLKKQRRCGEKGSRV